MEQAFLKIENSFYVRHAAAVNAGMTDKCLYNRSARNADRWDILPDPLAVNRKLYGWDAMKPEDRDLIKSYYKSGPAEWLAIEPIRQLIKRDDKAEAFFIDHRYLLKDQRTPLPPAKIEEYTNNASLLNMLLELTKDKRRIKKQFGMKLMPWFDQVFNLIKADGYNLPVTYANLISRETSVLKRYENEGYASLISDKFGTQNAAKVKDLAKDMMLELLSHPNQYDDEYISKAFNVWAKREGFKTVTRATIKNKRLEFGYLIKAEREGWQEHNKTFSRRVYRQAPSQPGYLWEGDDNHIDWWFADDFKKGVIHRLKCYVVVDSFKGIEYPLGWAFSEKDITAETIKLAFLMAMHHIKDLTGGWYLPHEFKTDRWNLKAMREYYKGLGHYYDAPLGQKNRGWLENFFGHPDWKRSLKFTPDELPASNYTGHNISSKTMGVNVEALQATHRADQLPRLSEAGRWISAHFERLRTKPIGWEEGAKSRQQEWLEAWMALSEEKKRPISETQMLMKCGLQHGWQNEITKNGVQPTIAGHLYAYAVPPALYLQNVGRKVHTIYDPFDMNSVLLTDNEHLRFVAHHITPVAGCMMDMKEGGRSFLNLLIAQKGADVDTITESKRMRRERMATAGQDASITLRLGGMARKELKTAATEEWQEPEWIDSPRKSKALPAIADDFDYEQYAQSSL